LAWSATDRALKAVSTLFEFGKLDEYFGFGGKT
jgi:hypothetical protein